MKIKTFTEMENLVNEGKATFKFNTEYNQVTFISEGYKYVFHQVKYPLEWIMHDSEFIFTTQWSDHEPNWVKVIRCPRCRELVDDDWADCRSCGLEIRHRTISVGSIIVEARDPEYVPDSGATDGR